MLVARILLIMTALIWGSTFVATKVCLQYVEPIELMAFRFVISIPALLILIAINKAGFNLSGYCKRILIASFVIAAHFIIQITGIKYTTATNTGWIIALIPLIVAIMATVFLKEKITWKIVAGINMATIGILLLISKGHIADFSWLKSYGDWLVLASAHTWAIYTILIRDVSRKVNPLTSTFLLLIPSAILSLIFVFLYSDMSKFLSLPNEFFLWILMLGILGTALGHWFWQLGVARMGASRAGIFLYLEPIATTLVAVPYLKEPLSIFTIIGGVAVLLGVWISQK